MKNRIFKNQTKTNYFRNISGILLLIGILFGLSYIIQNNKKGAAAKLDIKELGHFPIAEPNLKYGFALDTFHVEESVIKRNQFLSDILLQHKVDYLTIDQLAKKSKDVFDVKNLRANKPYAILYKDKNQAANYFIYEPDVYKYVVYSLKDSLDIKIVEREITTQVKTASGIIHSSLWNTMVDNGLSFELTAKMEDALAWTIDFHHIQKDIIP